MKGKVFFSVFIIVGLLTMPVFAEEVKWGGIWVDSAEIPQLESQFPVPDEDAITPQNLPSWGTDSWSSALVGPCDACPRDGDLDFYTLNCNYIQPTNASSSATIGFPLDLPHGAEIQWIYIYYYDTHPTSNPSMGLWTSSKTGTASMLQDLTPPAFDGGNNEHHVAFSHTVNNWDNSYSILAILDRGATTTERIFRIIVWYKLVVSPAPAAASFTDVPTNHDFFRFVEALYDAGITSGCGQAGKYCPDDPVTRGQMAVFLSRSLGLHYPADADP